MQIIVIAHNIRSAHNVGSIFRTCDGFGVSELILSSYTPYPSLAADDRLPHLAAKLTNQIHKTALGAERAVPFRHASEVTDAVLALKQDGFRIVALEQTAHSSPLSRYVPADRTCLILGEEVSGISTDLLHLCDDAVEIAMRGQKESFNVSVAAGIALYALTSSIPT